MRVLMLTQSYAPIVGGIEHMVESISAELVKRGHDVAVATLRQPQSEPAGSEEVPVFGLGTSVHSLPGLRLDEERRHAPPGPDPRATRELRQLIRRFRPDVVHAHDWLIHSYLPLDRRSSVGLLLSMHDYGLTCATMRFMHKGSVCSGPGNIKCFRCACDEYASVAKGGSAAVGTRLFQGRVRNHVDVLLPVSTAVRDLCRLGPEDIHRVIPNFVPDPPPPLQDEPGLAQLPEEPFILYFGDVSEEKGVHHLVTSYRELDDPPPLVLIGRRIPGEVEDTTGARALGRMSHPLVLEALRHSLFTVAPSIWSDPFPLVALEAAAAGKPTIASRIGGLQDSVVDGETGFLVPPGNRPALLKAMRRLLDDVELRERMGAAAATRRATMYTPDTVVPQYEQAYELALEQRLGR
jgi:glycosyltransferase involved in cell wall biosynthesis